ncbi:MAG: helix-turn-helix domain-containing protein [Candidatus Aenigmarchaeota archaeon]|nr:helix-turn-helix domain-containing protein [Candidatus Aenigmarchaeota archaeon]
MVNELAIVNNTSILKIGHEVLQPQEVEVFYIIPTIRSSLTRYLKDRGLSQKDIAKILGIRESTVSQYVSSKRASKIKFSENVEEKIKESSKNINSKLDVIRETQKLLRFIRNSGEICNIHKKLCGLPGDCAIEKMGCSI